MLLEPLARNRLEGLFRTFDRRELFLFARHTGIDAVRDQSAHLLALVARLFQSDVWVHTERDALLLAGEAILEAPPAAPGGRDLEIQAAAVKPARSAFNALFYLDFYSRIWTPVDSPGADRPQDASTLWKSKAADWETLADKCRSETFGFLRSGSQDPPSGHSYKLRLAARRPP